MQEEDQVEMEEEEMEEDETSNSNVVGRTQNNFTPIQSRKFRRSTIIPCWSLCPSMDLVALGTGSSAYKFGLVEGSPSKRKNKNAGEDGSSPSIDFAESIAIHRIVSWQRLLSLTQDQLTSTNFNCDEDGIDNLDSVIHRENKEWERAEDGCGPLFQQLVSSCRSADGMDTTNTPTTTSLELNTTAKGATSICWSPDGRCVAIGLVDGGVLIHDVEPETTDDDDAAAAAEASGQRAGGHHALHIIHPHPLQLNPTLNTASFDCDDDTKNETAEELSATSNKAEPSRNNRAAFSPRVTRSMVSRRKETNALSSIQQQPIDENNNDTTCAYLDRDAIYQSTCAVIGMAWNRVSPPHSSWSLKKEEWEMKESWTHLSQLIDRGRYFLPTDCYDTTLKTKQKAGVGGSFSPLAHLNVLCVATSHELHWYLQGWYRIGSISHDFEIEGHNTGVDLVCSPDLTSVLVISKRPQSSNSLRAMATLYKTPLLGERRFDMQIISALYRSIFSRLREIREGIRSSADSWRSALRPLDTKFQGLFTLLCNYNVSQPNDSVADCAAAIRLELLRCILSGRSSVSGDASNALDHFFTRPQMHDQLFQREIKGVEASVASMEAKLRSKVLSPIRVLVYETGELYGIARSRDCDKHSSTLIDPEIALRLDTSAKILFLSFERCLLYVVEARGRLHDFLAWIRGTASQIRARGTAMDSIQRQNARNRRVPDGVIRRVSNFLSMPMMSAVKDSSELVFADRHLTECVIGVPLSDFFTGCMSKDSPTPPSNQLSGVRCTLKSALQSAFQICTVLFDKPRDAFTQTLDRLDVHFETPHSILAAHIRIGTGPGADKKGAFDPIMTHPDYSSFTRYWMIFVRSVKADCYLEVIAIPGNAPASFYLQAGIALPDNHKVRNIVFYGDSGNSSLSPNLDTDAVTTEGRQSLGLIVERKEVLLDGSEKLHEELWLFSYDNILFEKFDFASNSDKEISIAAADFSRDNCIHLQPSSESSDDSDNVLVPKSRHICTRPPTTLEQSNLNLCGSRGTACVICFGASTSLDILDLEEDEEDNASDDENIEE